MRVAELEKWLVVPWGRVGHDYEGSSVKESFCSNEWLFPLELTCRYTHAYKYAPNWANPKEEYSVDWVNGWRFLFWYNILMFSHLNLWIKLGVAQTWHLSLSVLLLKLFSFLLLPAFCMFTINFTVEVYWKPMRRFCPTDNRPMVTKVIYGHITLRFDVCAHSKLMCFSLPQSVICVWKEISRTVFRCTLKFSLSEYSP